MIAQPLERRIRDLRFGIERIIEKTKYDEYGTFEEIRGRIIALAQEILAEDNVAKIRGINDRRRENRTP